MAANTTLKLRRFLWATFLDVIVPAINSLKSTLGTLSDPGHTHTAGAITDGGHTHAGTASQLNGFVRYEAPIAAELISIVAALDPVANVTLTIAAQPDYPRKLQIDLVDANSSISAGVVTLIGVGVHGQAVTQAVPLTGGSATTITTHAYATLTSAIVTGLVGAAAGDTISIGVGAALGLPGPYALTPSAFTVYKSNLANANEAVGTVDATNATIIPTTAPDGSRNFSFWYRYTYTPAIAASNTTGITQAATASSTTGLTTTFSGSSKFHRAAGEQLIAKPAASNLATSLVLVNEIRAVYYFGTGNSAGTGDYPGHVGDTLAHLIADTVNVVAAPVADDLTTAMALANEIKADYNTHLSQAGVHLNNDGTNTIAAADATDQTSLNTLLNEMKTDINAHIANAVPGASIRLLDA